MLHLFSVVIGGTSRRPKRLIGEHSRRICAKRRGRCISVWRLVFVWRSKITPALSSEPPKYTQLQITQEIVTTKRPYSAYIFIM